MQITLTQDQIAKINELRKTTIAGNPQVVEKTMEQMLHSVIEYGVRAIEQQRKQYTRQRAALRAYSGK